MALLEEFNIQPTQYVGNVRDKGEPFKKRRTISNIMADKKKPFGLYRRRINYSHDLWKVIRYLDLVNRYFLEYMLNYQPRKIENIDLGVYFLFLRFKSFLWTFLLDSTRYILRNFVEFLPLIST